MLVLEDRLIELPGSAITGENLGAMQASLPGFDDERVIRAMGSTKQRVFRVWHPDSSKLIWAAQERRARFEGLVRRLGGDPLAAPATFAKLSTAWSEPARRYHDRQHLAECLLLLDELRAQAVDADLVELALWFHDAVHVPGSKENEKQSAELLLQEAARLGIDSARAATAAALVRWTEYRAKGTALPEGDAALVIDIDRSILGSDPLRFLEYDCAIEEEHPGVHGGIFRAKRGRFLASMLMRARIFQTEVAHARFEERARTQIKGLLASPRYRPFRIARSLLRWPST